MNAIEAPSDDSGHDFDLWLLELLTTDDDTREDEER